MTLKRTLFNAVTPLLNKFLGDERQANLSLALVPTIPVNTAHGDILFYSPNSRTVLEAKRLLILEPQTIAWIDSFEPEALFWDIGANSGLYTLYAAFSGAGRVVAFEPASVNAFLVDKNIEINRLSETIKAFSIAFDSETRIGDFIITNSQFSTAACALDSNTSPMINARDHQAFRQAVISYSIDDFREQFSMAVPEYIKIDVDGSEERVLIGAKKTLKDPNLKSVQVEVDVLVQPTYESVCALMKSAGFVTRNADELEQVITDSKTRYGEADRAAFDLRFDRR